MKSLKFLKEELLSKASDSKILNAEEQKQVFGGVWSTRAACWAACNDGPFKGTCYVDYVIGNAEYWECRES